MEHRTRRNVPSRFFFLLVLLLCTIFVVAAVILAIGHKANDIYSFSEPIVVMSDGWTLTDSAGYSREVSLPETIEYGEDGCYTLSTSLPEVAGPLVSPAFRFYSNYVDVRIAIDGEELYSFPEVPPAFSGATGNTYHFLRLPAEYAGKVITVSLRGQLGDDITYLLNPPLIGSKATILSQDTMRSLPSLTLAGCMAVLALGLTALYGIFRKRLALNNATLFTALFALLFALYVLFETTFAQLMMPNGYLLCFATLMLLVLLPIPLIGTFLDSVGHRFKPLAYGLILLCSLNFIIQMILNFAGIMSVRAMVPATHAVIIISILGISLCLFFTDRAEKPRARHALLSAVPMIIGGTVDIVLLNLNHPSLNNSFWFSLGVVIFVIFLLYDFVDNYLTLYHTAVEAKVLTEMAYQDVLAGIGNRNAYERKLKELSEREYALSSASDGDEGEAADTALRATPAGAPAACTTPAAATPACETPAVATSADVLSAVVADTLQTATDSLSSGLTDLCCIVMDINDLKLINDQLGHQAGDTAISEVGAILRECMPENAFYFRTGGDEFVVLLEGCDEAAAHDLEKKLFAEAKRHGELCSIPLSLAIGSGQYAAEDGNILDFIRRIDTLMYGCKRKLKAERGVSFR